jgi:hypothetical protein
MNEEYEFVREACAHGLENGEPADSRFGNIGGGLLIC